MSSIDAMTAYFMDCAEDPEWSKVGRVHDWRNYISEEVQGMWFTFSLDQRVALIRNAQDIADREEWN